MAGFGGKLAFAAALALLPMSGAEAQRATQKMAAVPVGDVSDWFPSDDYPADAVAAGRSGRTVVELGIDSAGAVVSCRVKESSGTTSLDQKTCELARLRGRFDPATDRRGRPVATTHILPVRWVVPEAGMDTAIDLPTKLHLDTEFEWVIGTDGSIESCRLLSGRSEGATDQCARWAPGRPWGARYKRDGVPVRTVVRDRFVRNADVAALPK